VQVGTFLASVREDRLYPAWLLLATLGIRRGELLGLRWVDVDLKRFAE
jgi:integrase